MDKQALQSQVSELLDHPQLVDAWLQAVPADLEFHPASAYYSVLGRYLRDQGPAGLTYSVGGTEVLVRDQGHTVVVVNLPEWAERYDELCGDFADSADVEAISVARARGLLARAVESLKKEAPADQNESPPVTEDEVKHDAFAIAGFLDYLRWLSLKDGTRQVSIADIWAMYQQMVVEGQYPSEVTERLNLPSRPEWD